MNRLHQKLSELRRENRKALTCFITAGFPNLKVTEKVIHILESCGVDILELGVPFSDPIADGPIIQYTSYVALKNNTSLKRILKFVKRIRPTVKIPIVIMSYFNPIYRYGIEKFFKDAVEHGIDGVIIPDCIPEEGGILKNLSHKHSLPVIYLLSTTTSEERQKVILRNSQEFVYVVSVTGVTGPREKLPEEILSFLRNVKKKSSVPLLLGFGIKSPKQIEPLKKYIDGVIIGSALLQVIDKSDESELKKNIEEFLTPFRKKLD